MNTVSQTGVTTDVKTSVWLEYQKTALTAKEISREQLRDAVGAVVVDLQNNLLADDKKYVQRLLRCVTRLSAIAYNEDRDLYHRMAAVVTEHFSTLAPYLPMDLRLKTEDGSTVATSALALMRVSDVFAKMFGSQFGESKAFIDRYPIGPLYKKMKIDIGGISSEQLWLLVDCIMGRELNPFSMEKRTVHEFDKTMDYWNIGETDRREFQDRIRCALFRNVHVAAFWHDVCPDLSSNDPERVERAVAQLANDTTVDYLLTLICIFEDLAKIEDMFPLLQRILSRIHVDWGSGSPEAIQILLSRLHRLGQSRLCDAYSDYALEQLSRKQSVPELLELVDCPERLIGHSLQSILSQATVDWSSGTVEQRRRLLDLMDQIGNPLAVMRYFDGVVGESSSEQLLRILERETLLPNLTEEESLIYAKRCIWDHLRQWFRAIADDWDHVSTHVKIRGAKQTLRRKLLDSTIVSNLKRFAAVGSSLRPWNFHGRELDGFPKAAQEWLMNAINGKFGIHNVPSTGS